MTSKRAILFTTLVLAAPAFAATPTAVPPPKATTPPASAVVKRTDALPFTGVSYRLIGPFRGGRASGVAGTATDPNVYYMGTAGGGVWKTVNAGQTWKPLWDNLRDASPSIGAVVVAPSDPNVVYAGTGEANIRGNVITGNGVWKSADAGKSWTAIGLADSQAIGRMAVHPTDPNILFVAALGHPFGPSQERGIYRTRDGGKTWARVLFVDDKTGGIDVQFDPADPSILYAGMWQAIRKPWIFESGGPGSGLYRSTDGGTTWQRLSGHGLPEGMLGRIGVAPTADPKRVYALIEADKGGLYRTDDGGQSWQLINGDNKYKQRAWYYSNVFADPKDRDKVFVMNTGAFKSLDGGKTFKRMPTFHGDNHSLWVNPLQTNYLINSNDGGGNVSVDGGDSWSSEMNQPTAQFYHVAADNRTPYDLLGSQQDNTSVEIASGNVRGPIGIESFHSVGGGESGYVTADPKDANIIYANGYGGNVTRYDGRTGATQAIGPWSREVIGWAPKDLTHRSQWTEPLVFSPHDANVLYNPNEVLFRSTDGGRSWTPISPDLTRNDKTKQAASGGPLTKDVTGVETYDTIFSVVESPLKQGLIWAGTDDGLIQLTTDGGAHWQNVTPKAMPEWGTVDMVEVDPRRAGTAYIAVDCHRLDDLRPHAFRTDDYGKSWVAITTGLPKDAYVHAIRTDPERAGLLYAGTEKGIFVSFDDGARWEPMQLNLPRTPVNDLVVHAGDLAVATHGRAFWVLDDLSAVRQWKPAIAAAPLHLFAPRAAMRILYGGRGDMTGGPTGANPPPGAVLYYYLKTGTPAPKVDPDAKDKDKAVKPAPTPTPTRVKLEILDAAGTVIRTFPNPRTKAAADPSDPDNPMDKEGQLTEHQGVNRFVWDLRTEAPTQVPHATLWNASKSGPVALPGQYRVRITADGRTQTQPLTIAPDPNPGATPADLAEQYELVRDINAELDQVQTAALEMRSLHHGLERVRAAAPAKPQVDAAARALDTKATAIEERVIQVRSVADEDPLNYPIRLNNMLASLASTVGQGDFAPTRQAYAEYAELKGHAVADLAEWSALKARDLPAFNAVLAQAKVKPLVLDAAAEQAAGAAEPEELDVDPDRR